MRSRVQPALLALAAFALTGGGEAAAQSYGRINKLFDGGSGFYHSFRVPAIVRASDGVLLAFAEGRVDDPDDWGNINLVYKRSNDHGRTWTKLLELEGVGLGAYKNPTAVYEKPWPGKPRGRVHLFYNWHAAHHKSNSSFRHGDMRTFYTYSDNDGLTWAKRQDLTSRLLPSDIGFDIVGPGNGIQKSIAPNVGRLVVPATRRNFHSDDHGKTWHMTPMPTRGLALLTSESTISECADGSLLRNDRAVSKEWTHAKRRWVTRGQIGNFPKPVPQSNLFDPRCHASMLRYNLASPARLVFLNSASTANRRRMKVRISYDDGVTWPRDRWLYVKTAPDFHATPDTAMNAGKGGYSAMTKTRDFHVAALVEINEKFTSSSTSMSIDFHRFDLKWMLDGQRDPICPELWAAQINNLPNVTQQGFVLTGASLHLVKTVYFGGRTIIGRDRSTWFSGWFRVVHSNRMIVYPPQGLAPGKYSISLAKSGCRSTPLWVTLRRQTNALLYSSTHTSGAFDLLACTGNSSAQTHALLTASGIHRPTLIPGIVNLGIGNQGQNLWVLGMFRANAQSGVVRWRFPALRSGSKTYFQAALYDPLARNPLPMPVTNVELVQAR